ncbi:hypothetical protein LEL_06891 [Akanthomyces lecanii RCEF 1005]|uniref:5'-3' DNA helicase ZGRF1-like N-terminal domain-containing protein n=1 Tax=Akanthomyces lecanii RCEF 1005 TaxID=1081108 RepID=A0A168FAQ2_CORDF|nr:hypothetical protein LEL_06891 [Akanthomyces lecanii RCEF 1005]
MSYAVGKPQASSPTSNDGPPSTATVYDFICLFTHDLRRKQKRWQDGKLKYHSFNKKVMVYDDRGHFVGDSHWDQEGDLAPGDELSLDRGMALVQVEDCTGEKQQDLTELLDKRAREVEKRRQIAAAKTRPAQRGSLAGGAQPPPQHRPHLSLNSLVQSPGPVGRAAIPAHSPFEARQQRLHQNQPPNADAQPTVSAPPAKKRRTSTSPPSKAGFARNLFGTTLNLSSCPGPELLAARARALRQRMLSQAEATSTPQEDEGVEEHIPMQSSPLFVQDDADATPSRPAKEQRSTLQPVTRHPIASARSVMREAEEVGNRNTETTSDKEDNLGQENAPKKHTKETRKQAHRTVAVDLTTQDAHPEAEPVIPEEPPKRKRKDKEPSQSLKQQQTEDRPDESRKQKPTVTRRSPSHNLMGIDEPDDVEAAPRHRKAPNESQRKKKEREKVAQESPAPVRREPKAKEPRTTLRMRSRQKRGLLMMREPSPPLPELSTSIQEEIDDRVAKTPSPEPSVPPPRQVRSASPEEVTILSSAPPVEGAPEPPPVDRIPSPALPDPSSEDDLPQPSKRRARKRRTYSPPPGPDVSEEEPKKKTCRKTTKRTACEDENPDAEQDPQPRKRRTAKRTAYDEERGLEPDLVKEESNRKTRRRTTKRIDSEDEDSQAEEDPLPRKRRAAKRSVYNEEVGSELEEGEGEEVEVSAKQGPRIAKLPRKGIRSREILGYIAQGIETMIPGPFASGSFRLGGPPVPAVSIAVPAEPAAAVPVEQAASESSQMQKRPAKPVTVTGAPVPITATSVEPVLPASSPMQKKAAESAMADTASQTLPASSVAPSPTVASPIEEKPAFSSHPGPEVAAAAPLKEVVTTTISPLEPLRPQAVAVVSTAAESTTTIQEVSTELGSRRNATIEAPPPAVRSNSSSNAIAPTTAEANETKLEALSAPEISLARVPRGTTAQASENAAPSEIEKKPDIVLQAPVPVPIEVLPTSESMSSGSETNQAGRPRIANPASRGKKAARREDAAGLAPQVMVPLEPVQPVVARMISTRPGGGAGRGRIAAAGPVAPSPPPPPAAAGAPFVAKKAASMPGFTSASGGTWSRHAHDLMGMNRPERGRF